MGHIENSKNRASHDYHTEQQHSYEHKGGTLLHEMCYSVKGFIDRHFSMRTSREPGISETSSTGHVFPTLSCPFSLGGIAASLKKPISVTFWLTLRSFG